MWIPSAIYKSSCSIDVTYFPFDEQECEMIFGSWTYNGDEVDLNWYTEEFTHVDVTNYEFSGTWDLTDCPGLINTTYDDDEGHSVTKTIYKVKLRRKTLYYAVNLIIPCALISSLSMIVFYLPSDAGEKATFSVSILLALVVYLQVRVHEVSTVTIYIY